MSNERDFEGRDSRVSEAYQQTAQERTPEALNQTILGMASGTAARRPGGVLFASWVKPVAWAATIGLSLTIVLELTRAPDSMDAAMPAPASIAVESVREDFERHENRAVEAAKVLEQMQTGPNNQDVLKETAVEEVLVETIAIEEVVLEKVAIKEVVLEEVALEDAALDEVALEDAALDEDIAAFSADIPMSDQSSFAARSRVTGLVAPAFEMKESDLAADCDAEARAAANTWLLCIETLRESGELPAAEREYAKFLLEHPDSGGQ